MASQFLLRRSDVPNKRPDPALMASGALNLNYDPVSGGVFYKDSAGDLVKLGPAQVSANAPNLTPTGEPGNSLGEFWYDTSTELLKIWDGTSWITAGAEVYPLSITEGSTVPVNTSGNDGDLFLLTSSNPQVIYQKVSGTWVTNRVLTDMATNAAYNQSRLLTLEQLSDVAGTNNYAPAGAVQAAIVTSTPTVTYQFASQLVTIVLDGIAAIGAVTIQGAIFPGTTLYFNGTATSGSGDWFVSVISLVNTSIPPNNQLTIRAILEPGSESNFLGLTGIVQNAFSATVVGTGPFGYVAIDAGNPSAGDLLIRSSTNENWTTGPNFPTFLQAGSGISVNYDATDSEWTVSASNAGTVTSVSGTAPITVDNTVPASPVIGVATASTTTFGVVTLTNDLTSTSEVLALTANAGKELQDQINALVVSGVLELAGTIDAATGLVASVTTEGTSVGFVVGDPLPAAAAGNSNHYVVVTTPGTFTPPGGVATSFINGDWVLSDGTAWQKLAIGPEVSPGGANTSIQYNDNGDFGGDLRLVWDEIAGVFKTNNISSVGAADPLSLISGGNLTLTGAFTTITGTEVLITPVANPTAGFITISGGRNETAGATGGNLALQGGAGSGNCTAGDVTIQGGEGDSGTDSNGGKVTIQGGAAQGSGTDGSVQIRDISIASVIASYVPTVDTDLVNKAYADSLATPPGGTTTQVQYNDGGTFEGNSAFTFDSANGVVSVSGITANTSSFTLGSSVSSSSLTLTSGGGSEANPAGNVNITAANGTSNNLSRGGSVTIRSGTGRNNGGQPGAGDINIISADGGFGTASGNAGGISITAGSAGAFNSSNGGSISIQAGNASSNGGSPGNVTIAPGSGGGVSISQITSAVATSGYVPTNATDLATKAYVDGLPSAAAGADTQVQFNNNGALGANANFTFSSVTNTLTVEALLGVETVSTPFTITTPDSTGPVSNNIEIQPGGGFGGGNVLIQGGETNLAGAPGGDVTIRSGGGIVGTPAGDLYLLGGDANTGGDVHIAPGSGITPATDGSVLITGIASAVTSASYAVTVDADLTTKSYVDTVLVGLVAGANTQVQFNDNGVFGANADFTFDASTSTLRSPVISTPLLTCANTETITIQPPLASNNVGADITITSGRQFGTGGRVGNILIQADYANGGAAAGTVTIAGGRNLWDNVASGNVEIYGGDASPGLNGQTGYAGNIVLRGGNAATLNTQTTGGSISISGGEGTGTAVSGSVTITGGNGRNGSNAPGGNVIISGGTAAGTGTNGSVSITAIVSAVTDASYVVANGADLTTKTYVDTAVAGAGSPAAGGAGAVQYSDGAGVFVASAGFTFDSVTGDLVVPGSVTSTAAGTLTPTDPTQLGAAFTTTGELISVASFDAGTF